MAAVDSNARTPLYKQPAALAGIAGAALSTAVGVVLFFKGIFGKGQITPDDAGQPKVKGQFLSKVAKLGGSLVFGVGGLALGAWTVMGSFKGDVKAPMTPDWVKFSKSRAKCGAEDLVESLKPIAKDIRREGRKVASDVHAAVQEAIDGW